MDGRAVKSRFPAESPHLILALVVVPKKAFVPREAPELK